MNTLELRKMILTGVDDPGPDGSVRVRVVFWIPARTPFKRCSGKTEVINALPFELAALKDGAIVEHAQRFTFPEQPSLDEMRRRLMPVWEGLTVESLGVLPNGAPVDLKPKLALQFTAVSAAQR